MHIQSIEIDGFKSYAQRQVVEDLDPMFNAITGLNGSGKSNILDSLCFVLGITNLTQIRAASLNDLVYKVGQAGVTKASVTITFNNSDKAHSPIGYHSHQTIIIRRQVIVNGRNFYTINGANATNSKVADFFRGIGLNVNNPHFLIMQGRITKVLNMKPKEILSMVEEAAGTKMYEVKRTAARALMQRKDIKLNEIDKLMKDDINPTMERLREDRQNYLDYKKFERECSTYEKKLAAFTYHFSLLDADRLDLAAKSKEADVLDHERAINELEAKITDMENEHKRGEAAKAGKNNNEKQNLDKMASEATAEYNAKEIELDGLRTSIKSCIAEQNRCLNLAKQDNQTLEKKKADLAKKDDEVGGEAKAVKELEQRIFRLKEEKVNLASGYVAGGQSVSLDGQINDINTRLTPIQTQLETYRLRENKMAENINNFKQSLKKSSKESSETHVEALKQLEKQVAHFEGIIKRVNFPEERFTELQQQKEELRGNSDAQQNAIETIQRSTISTLIPKYDWKKKDGREPPDHIKRQWNEKEMLIGSIGMLFEVSDRKYAQALEIASKSMLSHLVIKESTVATYMLQNFHFRHRNTLIPMKDFKDTSRPDLMTRVEKAIKMVRAKNEEAYHAIDLVKFDPKYRKVMEYVFKGIIICETSTSAKELAFNHSYRLRCVTFQGDEVKPGGTMSGGSENKNKKPILVEMVAWHAAKEQQTETLKQLEEVSRELESLEPKRKSYFEAKDKLETACNEAALLREQISNDPREKIAKLLEEEEKSRAAVLESVNGLKAQAKELDEQIRELQDRKKNEKAYLNNAKKKIEKELEEAIKEQNKYGNSDNNTKVLDAMRTEIMDLEKQAANNLLESERAKAEAEANTNKLATVEGELAVLRAAKEAANDETKKFQNLMKKHDEEMRALQKTIDNERKNIQKQKNQIEICLKDKAEHVEDASNLRKQAKSLAKHHKWIEDEKQHFGEKGTDYDFEGFDKEIGTKHIEDLKQKIADLNRRINTKGMSILNTAEEKVLSLAKKQEIVLRDKFNLIETMNVLDEKKDSEVMRAHKMVNADFGNIFSTLLPGTMAKLEPPEGEKVTVGGLEVKVAFNGKWKQSLNELSGGQRSLVALSLVLAMLKFKPAPIYILDEVDAALDLSHTQNIGNMIKQHFKKSQFIIVSLKEGMFNHANVIYRTRFVDGTSMITRTLGSCEDDEASKP